MKFTGEQYHGVVELPDKTKGFTFNHAILRVKDLDSYWIEVVDPRRMV